MAAKMIMKQGNQTIKDGLVEWYSGNELYTHPRRIRIKGIWEDVFQYDRISRENTKQQREIVFRCHIGDNRVIVVVVSLDPGNKG